MGFKCGIVGLPNVGKSTIFNALTASQVEAQNYPFCTIEPNKGVVAVPDPRLDVISSFIHPERVLHSLIEFVDIAGLVKGASRGEGLGNKFLGHIRETDAIAHVVRCFTEEDVTHVEGGLDPIRDIDIIHSELIIVDSETVGNAKLRYGKLTRSGDKKALMIMEMLEALEQHLQSFKLANAFSLKSWESEKDVARAFRELHMLTAKRIFYVCNVDESMASGTEDNEYTKLVREHAAKEGAQVVLLCGKVEQEISTLPKEEQGEFLEALGLKEPGLNRLIRLGYQSLGLQTYFTAGVKEVRSWTIPQNCTAPRAAGVIHSDFERGFICAEVYKIDELVRHKSKQALKEAGALRIEGKEYLVQDGDVMEFRFNV